MKLNFLKKAGILGAAVVIMATTVMAQSWELNMNKTTEAITKDSAQKVARSDSSKNNRAFFTRTDTDWSRSPFLAYTEATSYYKSRAGLIGGNSGEAYYINYNDSFIGKNYKTHAMLSSTAYYSSLTIPGTTSP